MTWGKWRNWTNRRENWVVQDDVVEVEEQECVEGDDLVDLAGKRNLVV